MKAWDAGVTIPFPANTKEQAEKQHLEQVCLFDRPVRMRELVDSTRNVDAEFACQARHDVIRRGLKGSTSRHGAAMPIGRACRRVPRRRPTARRQLIPA